MPVCHAPPLISLFPSTGACPAHPKVCLGWGMTSNKIKTLPYGDAMAGQRRKEHFFLSVKIGQQYELLLLSLIVFWLSQTSTLALLPNVSLNATVAAAPRTWLLYTHYIHHLCEGQLLNYSLNLLCWKVDVSPRSPDTVKKATIFYTRRCDCRKETSYFIRLCRTEINFTDCCRRLDFLWNFFFNWHWMWY